jgi:hypothetical protein
MRLLLTSGQKKCYSATHALLSGAPADFVIADAAYDVDHIREAIAKWMVKLSFRTIRRGPSRTRLTLISMRNAIAA